MHAERGARTHTHTRGVETETCLFTTLWVNICLVQKKKEKKETEAAERERETVALMLLEQLPTQMTKLPPKPFHRSARFTCCRGGRSAEGGRATRVEPLQHTRQRLQGRVITTTTHTQKTRQKQEGFV